MADEVVNLEVGQSAPDFEAELTDGTTMRLSEIIAAGEKVILYFTQRIRHLVVLPKPVTLGIILLNLVPLDTA